MCVLICATSNVREWLDVPSGLAYWQALQLCPVFISGVVSQASHQSQPFQPFTIDGHKLDQVAQRLVTNRSARIQAQCRYHAQSMDRGIQSAEHGGSSRDWQKALETIAKTWGRLLSLVGLGW
jgi:hypothetical protein